MLSLDMYHIGGIVTPMNDMYFSLTVRPELQSLALLNAGPGEMAIFYALALNQRFTPAPVSLARLEEMTEMRRESIERAIVGLGRLHLVKAFTAVSIS